MSSNGSNSSRVNSKIELDKIRDKGLFVATPMYGGMCHGIYHKSMCGLSALAAKHGVKLRTYYLFNESLITRARNYCVDEFLRSDCEYMLFVDSDIGFEPKDVMLFMQLMTDHEDMRIVTGAYPKKTIAWEKVKKAVEMGYADEHPSDLNRVVGDYVFNPIKGDGETKFAINEPIEVREAGTGFMMMHREVFDKYKKAYPELEYLPDHVRTEHFSGDRMIHAYFHTDKDPETKRYLSEDYFFCYNSRKIGISVWLCPWVKLEHMGTYKFGGSLADISAINASPTATIDSKHRSKSKDKGKNKKAKPTLKKVDRPNTRQRGK